MDATVLSWDDSGNNKHMLSGRGSYTINAPSIYLRAQREKMPFAPSVRHTLAPSGPKGRFFYADIHGWGVFKFSQNIDLAKQFLRSMFTEASQKTALTLGSGYDMPVRPHSDQNPPYAKDRPCRSRASGPVRWTARCRLPSIRRGHLGGSRRRSGWPTSGSTPTPGFTASPATSSMGPRSRRWRGSRPI